VAPGDCGGQVRAANQKKGGCLSNIGDYLDVAAREGTEKAVGDVEVNRDRDFFDRVLEPDDQD
jgi:hypothetical protein